MVTNGMNLITILRDSTIRINIKKMRTLHMTQRSPMLLRTSRESATITSLSITPNWLMRQLEDTTTVSIIKIIRATTSKRWFKERDKVVIMIPLISKPLLTSILLTNMTMRTTLKIFQKELTHSPLSKEEPPCQEWKSNRNGKNTTKTLPLEFKEIEKSTRMLGIANMLKKRMPNLMSSFKLDMSTTATKTILRIFQMD